MRGCGDDVDWSWDGGYIPEKRRAGSLVYGNRKSEEEREY